MVDLDRFQAANLRTMDPWNVFEKAACWFTIWVSCSNASSSFGVLVGPRWERREEGEELNETQWCGNPGKDVSVKEGEVEDGSQWPWRDRSHADFPRVMP